MCVLDDLGCTCRRKSTGPHDNSEFKLFVQLLNCFPKQPSRFASYSGLNAYYPPKFIYSSLTTEVMGLESGAVDLRWLFLTNAISHPFSHTRDPRALVSPSLHVTTYRVHYSATQNTALTRTMVLPNIENLS